MSKHPKVSILLLNAPYVRLRCLVSLLNYHLITPLLMKKGHLEVLTGILTLMEPWGIFVKNP